MRHSVVELKKFSHICLEVFFCCFTINTSGAFSCLMLECYYWFWFVPATAQSSLLGVDHDLATGLHHSHILVTTNTYCWLTDDDSVVACCLLLLVSVIWDFNMKMYSEKQFSDNYHKFTNHLLYFRKNLYMLQSVQQWSGLHFSVHCSQVCLPFQN